MSQYGLSREFSSNETAMIRRSITIVKLSHKVTEERGLNNPPLTVVLPKVDLSIPRVLGCGEVGYPIASQSAYANSGSYERERGGALDTFKAAPDYGVGVLWWASNFNDNYKLVDVVQGQPLTNEFAPGATLNEAGLAFKQYVQACNALNQS